MWFGILLQSILINKNQVIPIQIFISERIYIIACDILKIYLLKLVYLYTY